MDSSVSPKDEIWFLRVCHHISTGLYLRKMKKRSNDFALWNVVFYNTQYYALLIRNIVTLRQMSHLWIVTHWGEVERRQWIRRRLLLLFVEFPGSVYVRTHWLSRRFSSTQRGKYRDWTLNQSRRLRSNNISQWTQAKSCYVYPET